MARPVLVASTLALAAALGGCAEPVRGPFVTIEDPREAPADGGERAEDPDPHDLAPPPPPEPEPAVRVTDADESAAAAVGDARQATGEEVADYASAVEEARAREAERARLERSALRDDVAALEAARAAWEDELAAALEALRERRDAAAEAWVEARIADARIEAAGAGVRLEDVLAAYRRRAEARALDVRLEAEAARRDADLAYRTARTCLEQGVRVPGARSDAAKAAARAREWALNAFQAETEAAWTRRAHRQVQDR